MLPSGIRLGCFLFKMPEDLLNHFGVFNAGNNLDLTTTVFAHFDIDIEYSLEALHPGHPVMALCGIFVTPVSIEIFQFVGPLAPLSRCHLNTVFTIWREDAMETCEVNSWLGYQSSQFGNEV